MIGQRLLHYEIVEKLGEGGMGVVYKARDTHLDRFAAIKVLPPEKVADPARKARFVQEAKAASALNHPNIITIYDISSDAGRLFIAMEHVAGKTLDQIIPRKGMQLSEALKVAAQIADALARAHQAGIIHRDLKPANIMVDAHGLVKVLDFGLAKLTERGISADSATVTIGAQTDEGAVVGTAAYMSPEQARGEKVDARTDLFAFGAVLYQMLTGRQAFPGSSTAVIFDAVLNRRPAALRTLSPQTPVHLEEIVDKALEKDRTLRYQSAAELLADLQDFQRDTRPAPAACPGRIEAIAVLPLELLPRDPDQEYFSDGMTEELITQLSKIGSLRVISRTSVMQYKGAKRPLPEIARTLNVDAVVEGSILRFGDRIRISARLIDARSDRHLWGDRYDRELRDVLALLSEVAVAIAQEIRITLTPQEQVRLTAARQVDPEAYEDYLKGLHHWGRLSRDGYEKAIEHFERAIRKDQNFAASYAAAALVHTWRAMSGFATPASLRSRAIAAAAKAVELDDTLAEAHAALGWTMLTFNWDFAAAESALERAIGLNPSSARACSQYALYLAAVGRRDEAVAYVVRARRLDPTSAAAMWESAVSYFEVRRYGEASALLRQELELYPDAAIAHAALAFILAREGSKIEALASADRARSLLAEGEDIAVDHWIAEAYFLCGRKEEAFEVLRTWERLAEHSYVDAFSVASCNATLGQGERAIEWLERAFEERSPLLAWVKAQPAMDSLHSDPRYQDLVRRMNYPS